MKDKETKKKNRKERKNTNEWINPKKKEKWQLKLKGEKIERKTEKKGRKKIGNIRKKNTKKKKKRKWKKICWKKEWN